jgi:D-tyrosyl-tRNA(Tyr) deacylase
VRAVVQRVTEASVRVGDEVTGRIKDGLLVLVAAEKDDTDKDILYVTNKISKLRIFPDSEGRMNLSVLEAGGGLLLVSQFTLMGDVRKGLRPSFEKAESPEKARKLLEVLTERLKETGLTIECGRFQEDMKVELINDGPVTIMIDSRKLF